MYSKPLVLMNEDIAEGVFAASGSEEDQDLCYCYTGYISWGSTGQKYYSVYVPENSDTNLEFKVTFSGKVDSIWGMNASWTLSSDKKSATASVYSCSGQQSITIQGPTSSSISKITRTK